MSKYNKSAINYSRRRSIEVDIAGLHLGANNPIRLQTMANTSTMDTEASIKQAYKVVEAGADLFRYTAQGVKEATNLGEINREIKSNGLNIPLVADIHFNPSAAFKALDTVEKVRINPGNFVDKKTTKAIEWTEEKYQEAREKVFKEFSIFVDKAKELNRAIRIGVNHGSLSERMLSLYGDTPLGMVESALEYLDVCRQKDFHNVVISMKSSNVRVMTESVKLLSKILEDRGYPAYPLHLGVTEAGEGEDGRIKSAVGIGSLLRNGFGDTIRVSLSEDPEFEIPVAKTLVEYVSKKYEKQDSDFDISQEGYDEIRAKSISPLNSLRKELDKSPYPLVLSNRKITEFTKQKSDFILSSDLNLLDTNNNIILKNNILIFNADKFSAEHLESEYNFDNTIIILESNGDNPVGAWRKAFYLLRSNGIENPLILSRTYNETDLDSLRIKASVDFGTIMLDDWASGLLIEDLNFDANELLNISLGVLQASRLRMSKTEYISCPGCGRTLFALQDTIASIKAATFHIKGIKIGIMGCIVNGPGEMADADYGYVGSVPGKIDLYKGQECILKAVPQESAVETLIQLIKDNGDWVEPE